MFSRANGSTFKEISASEVRSIPISLPSLAEQKKIADFLSLIDERIQCLSEIIKELKAQKAGLLNQLFSQKLRFPEFSDEWKATTLGAIAERITRKNVDNTTQRVLTISAQYGLINQRDFFNKTVASTNLEGYYLLNKGEFAYNRSSSADYPWGAIKRLDNYNEGVLSTLYICFAIFKEDTSFLAHFFKTSQWHNYIQSISAEGARNHGLLNIAVSDFFALPLALPSISEQRKIADFLSLVDERIEVEEELLQQYEKQKRYLLRQMFF